MKTELFFSCKTDQWETPQDFFDQLDSEFHFTLDPCADEMNHKCDRYFTKDQDGLQQDWSGEVVFCNPPMAGRLASGCRSALRKCMQATASAWCCYCLQTQTPSGFTIGSTTRLRSDSLREG